MCKLGVLVRCIMVNTYVSYSCISIIVEIKKISCNVVGWYDTCLGL